MFEYDKSLPLDLQVTDTEKRGEVTVSDITYAAPDGRRIPAYLVAPEGDGPFAAILYVHWYEPPKPSSGRTEFLEEAVAMARKGVVSLLPETMWSPHEWYDTRNRDEDYDATVRQTVDLRRALDVLLAQPGVDSGRVAVVGHDFGGMFGAILAGVDGRARSYVIMGSTPQFADWYLFGPPMEDEAKVRYVARLAELDPVRHIRRAHGAGFLFQFGRLDEFVPEDKAAEFVEAAPGTPRVEWYDAVHELDIEQAHKDRAAWLAERLDLLPNTRAA
jgi:dienelactone hydrolase